jgi:hypothetical protein
MYRTNNLWYRLAHGKDPRGYGGWIFEIGKKEYWVIGKYSKAKARAVKMARGEGVKVYEVRVLP